MSYPIQFPSEQIISAHLTEFFKAHRCTCEENTPFTFPIRTCFSDLKIIELAAKRFANQTIHIQELCLAKLIQETQAPHSSEMAWVVMHAIELGRALENICLKEQRVQTTPT